MRIVERLCRTLAVVLILWLLWSALRPVVSQRVERVRASEFSTRLAGIARDPDVAAVRAVLDSSISSANLDLLRAIRRAGVSTSWEGNVPPIAIDAQPVPEPGGELRIAIAAPGRTTAIIADANGVIDTLQVGEGRSGAELTAPLVTAPARATVGHWTATAPAPDSLTIRPILVLGQAGWESKFLIAALEERGWAVAARLALAPGHDVEQGRVAPIDTARFAAVIALDSTAWRASDALRRYVRSGGGLVIAGRAAAGSLAALAPARTGREIPTRPALVADSVSPRTVARVALGEVRQQGVVLSRDGGEVMIVARREGAGRVAQVGLEESWRWRMEGAAGSEESHRRWWSRLVASVAYAPPVARPSEVSLAAPRAAVLDALGPPSDAPTLATRFEPLRHLWMLGAILGLLLLEWLSRRLRGAR
jgi:hypothetical protein